MMKAAAAEDGRAVARRGAVSGSPETGMVIIFAVVCLYSYTLMLVYLLS